MSSSVSGFISSIDVNATSKEFTMLTDLPTQGFNRLVKARRNGRWWMLKGLKDEYLCQSGYRELLRKEFDIIEQMNHLGIVKASSFEEVPGVGPCIVMEWIDGQTLKEWLCDSSMPKKKRRELGGGNFRAVA